MGVTAQQVVDDPIARDRFLSTYYRPKNRGSYDTAFNRVMKETQTPSAFNQMLQLNRMSPKPKGMQ